MFFFFKIFQIVYNNTMSINLYLAFALAFLLMVAIPTTLVFVLKNKSKTLKPIIAAMTTIYLCFLFVGTLTLFSKSGDTITFTFNFSSTDWFSSYFIWGSFGKLNILINLLMMFPVGYVVFTFSKKHKFLKTIIASFLLSVTIELLQFILPIYRNTEVLDIALNTISGIISATYCWLLSKISKNTIFKQ